MHDNSNHSPPDIYFVKRSQTKLEACLDDESQIQNMLKRADKNYIGRFNTFGIDPIADLTALHESFVVRRPEVSPKDPFVSYGKPR